MTEASQLDALDAWLDQMERQHCTVTRLYLPWRFLTYVLAYGGRSSFDVSDYTRYRGIPVFVKEWR